MQTHARICGRVERGGETVSGGILYTGEPTRSIRRKCNLLSYNFCYEYDIFNLVTDICGKISQLKSHEILRRYEEHEIT